MARILLSEGSSTSAREAITALGLKGHELEICDPDRHCIGRFSRFVRRFHRCPGLGADPEGYWAFMRDLISRGRFDVLLPIHEQGFLFAKVQAEIAPHVAVALPCFDSYRRAHSKAGFSRLLAEIGLPQPRTEFLASAEELLRLDRFPVVVKLAIGTASRGTWMVTAKAELEPLARDLARAHAFDNTVLVQDLIPGPVEHAQAVFSGGDLVAMHAYRQIARGAGGGDAIKESVGRPQVREHLIALGAALNWHGALSVDYILPEDDTPLYIDCNPRLVEPMSAMLAGLDLADLLVRVSRGETPGASGSQPGVRTHIALQALLGSAIRSGSRLELLRECWCLLTAGGPYAGSREELTPVRSDWLSAVPVTFAALWLLANPKAAHGMAAKGWGAHLLTTRSADAIRRWTIEAPPGR